VITNAREQVITIDEHEHASAAAKNVLQRQRVCIVTGGSSGLGAAIISHLSLSTDFTHIINWSLDTGVDVTSEAQVKSAANKAFAHFNGKIDCLINCAGINHIESITKLEIDNWDKVMDTNARGLWLTTKYLADMMKGGTILNIVSNAAVIPMTNSIAYNASKSAALMITKQMSRELGKTHDITVFSVSPNKLTDTKMSDYINTEVCRQRGWTLDEAKAYQLAALPAGIETDTNTLAEFIAFLLSTKKRHLFLQGCDLTYGGPV